MDWMLTHQLSSKNLSVGEKLAMTDELKKEVALENEKKRLDGNSKGGSSKNEVSLQLECNLKEDNPIRKDTWTDSQTAKKVGVGGVCFIPLMDNMISLIGREVVRINPMWQIRHLGN